MNMKDLITKTHTELGHELRDTREALRVFRFEISGSKIKNIKTGKNLKKKIAQIMTVMNSKTASK